MVFSRTPWPWTKVDKMNYTNYTHNIYGLLNHDHEQKPMPGQHSHRHTYGDQHVQPRTGAGPSPSVHALPRAFGLIGTPLSKRDEAVAPCQRPSESPSQDVIKAVAP